jgi:hypothetical protein
MSKFDPYYGARTPVAPAQNGFPIVPMDYAPLPSSVVGIYVGSSGSIALFLRGDPPNQTSQANNQSQNAPLVFNNVQAGTILPVAAAIVMATGTTATGLIGLI